jgi:hypothetical protein
MDRGVGKLFQFLLSRSATWLGIAALGLLYALFTWWFQPSLPMHGLAVLIVVLSLAFGFFLNLSSPALKEFLNRMPYESRGRELKRLLPGCTRRFRELGAECLSLTEKIGAEFGDQGDDAELGSIVGNLVRLAESNRELRERSQAFGTAEQKNAMDRLLDRQLASLENILTQLKAFSGNLTLLRATTEQGAVSVDDLRAINQGLEEALKEVDNG